MAMLLSFARREPRHRGWSNEELAQFERIRHLLANAGIAVEIDKDISDEGDPWCAFCSEAGDVVIHVARIDGKYVFDSAVLPEPLTGSSLNACAERFIDNATVLSPRYNRNFAVRLHPSAMLAGVILTIFLFLEASTERTVQASTDTETDSSDLGTSVLADGDAEAVSEQDGKESLLTLKLILQQLADLAAKPEEERTGQHMHSPGHGLLQFVPVAAIVAAITFVKESNIQHLLDDPENYGTSDNEDMASFSPKDTAADAGNDPVQAAQIGMENNPTDTPPAETEQAAADLSDSFEFDIADVLYEPDAYFIPRDAQAEPRATHQDRFNFVDQGFFADAPADQTASGTQIAAYSAEPALPQWFSYLLEDGGQDTHASLPEGLIKFFNEITGDFGAVTGADPSVAHPASPLAPQSGSDIASWPGTGSNVSTPPEPVFAERSVIDPGTVFKWFQIFDEFTGDAEISRYDDRVVIYDSTIDFSGDQEFASRTFDMRDHTVTFVGTVQDIDLLFA